MTGYVCARDARLAMAARTATGTPAARVIPAGPVAVRSAGLLTPMQVSGITGQAVATLTTWRCRGIGPPFVKIGRKVFYKANSLQQWIDSRERVMDNEPTKAKRKLALPILGGRPKVDRRHRLGGHRTQSERRDSERSVGAGTDSGRQRRSTTPGGPGLQ